MTDDDFLSDLRIEPFDTKTVKRQAKEEFFVRRLREIESGLASGHLGVIKIPTYDPARESLNLFWDRFVQENGP